MPRPSSTWEGWEWPMPRPGLHMGGMGVANASSWVPHGRDGSGQCLVLGSTWEGWEWPMPRPGLHMGGMGVANSSSWVPHGRDGSGQFLVLGSTWEGWEWPMPRPGLHMGEMGVANASSWADDHFLATPKAAQFLGKFCSYWRMCMGVGNCYLAMVDMFH